MSEHQQHTQQGHRFLFFSVMLILGGVGSWVLFGAEAELVRQYLNSYPNAFRPFHLARPYILTVACLLPALGGVYYACSGILDRYLLRKFFSMFTISLFAFLLIWFLLDWQNVHGDFGDVKQHLPLIGTYYLVQLPSIIVMMSPFVLLLSSLFVLGQLSNHKELTAMIQTGRGLLRVTRPLLVLGVLLSLLLSALNYHWAAWGENYKDGVKDFAKHSALTRARDVVASTSSGRIWYVGLFPHNYYEGEALRHVEISFSTPSGIPEKRLRAHSASWDFATGYWTLRGVSELQIKGKQVPVFQPLQESVIYKDWEETPSQLITPGLEATSLGIPELTDWLNRHNQKDWSDRLPYITQWHARWAKPWACLVAVLLAVPLGVVFSRKGVFSGVIVAIVLCILLFFGSEILLAMGEGGYLSPWWSAWSANLFFAFIAVLMLIRRIQNRPIHQALFSFFSLMGGKQ